jgi:hypothetical protein
MLIRTTNDRTTVAQAIGHIRPKQTREGWVLRLSPAPDGHLQINGQMAREAEIPTSADEVVRIHSVAPHLFRHPLPPEINAQS